jgi:hypothetical protein
VFLKPIDENNPAQSIQWTTVAGKNKSLQLLQEETQESHKSTANHGRPKLNTSIDSRLNQQTLIRKTNLFFSAKLCVLCASAVKLP